MKKESKDLLTKAGDYLAEIKALAQSPYTIMEVCGTHTVAIAKNALRELLPT